MSADSNGCWGELGQELWMGDPRKIRAAETRKQKTDARDAAHLLDLLLNGQFEKQMRIWMPTPTDRDVRQLVLHRHRLVGMRTRVKNQLRAVALNEGLLGSKPGLWSEKGQAQFRALALPSWSERRRADNLELLAELVRRTDDDSFRPRLDAFQV